MGFRIEWSILLISSSGTVTSLLRAKSNFNFDSISFVYEGYQVILKEGYFLILKDVGYGGFYAFGTIFVGDNSSFLISDLLEESFFY